jgi:hypothetical protein
MTVVLILIVIVLVIALAALAWVQFGARLRGSRAAPTSSRRILFPFVAADLSPRALDAALRLAGAEGATLVPVFLARVPLQLPLDAPLPRQCDAAIPLLEAIEQRARRFDVPVDSRIERGRTNRHALSQTIANERFDRIVVAAGAGGNHGFNADDVAWLLGAAPGEIVVLRPDSEERITPASARRRWAPRPRGDAHQAIRARAGVAG